MCAVSMIIDHTRDNEPWKQWDFQKDWQPWIETIKKTKKKDEEEGLPDCESVEKLDFLNELEEIIRKRVKKELKKILKELDTK